LTPLLFTGIITGESEQKMSIKILLLKSGETVISDVKEMIEKDILDKEKIWGYLLKNPFKMSVQSPMFLSEEIGEDSPSIQVAFSPWILLTEDKEMPIPYDWVVTIVEPVKDVKQMYEEKINEQNNKVSTFKG
jgi:hypothetical protein